MRSDTFGKFQFGYFFEKSLGKYALRNVGKILEELEGNGSQNQLPRHFVALDKLIWSSVRPLELILE